VDLTVRRLAPPPYNRLLGRLSRREVLNVVWKLGLAALPAAASSRVLTQPAFRSYPFTLGIASGDPWPESVVLWTRLAPDPLEGGGMPPENVEVAWEVAVDSEFRKIVRTGVATARHELGHTVHVEAGGLKPGWEYWYRFRAGGEVSPTGRTRTAPRAGAPTDQVRFAVCGCSHYESGYFTAFRHIAAEHVDFVFHTGDYIYESGASRAPNRIRRHLGEEAVTLADYRTRYAQYKLDPDLQIAHASAPFAVTWDDHEVDNNYAGDTDQLDTPPEVFLLRRAAAYQAYYEMMPLRTACVPAGASMRLYRRLRFGNLVDLSVLDTRQFRSRQACGGGTASECAGARDPDRSILGADQERWLFDTLRHAKARWTVIGQQVPTFPIDTAVVNPAGRFEMDQWEGYLAARDRLYRRLREMQVPNPVVLSGDVHVHFAAELRLDYRDPTSAAIGVELTNTSVSSGGDGANVAGNWERIRGDNPHIRYHSSRRGYIVCTASPDVLRADFKIIDRITVPDHPVETGASLVVEAGRPALVPA
jgi:alkaline phosphatase D